MRLLFVWLSLIFLNCFSEAKVAGTPKTTIQTASSEITIEDIKDGDVVEVTVLVECGGKSDDIDESATLCIPSEPTLGELSISKTIVVDGDEFIHKSKVLVSLSPKFRSGRHENTDRQERGRLSRTPPQLPRAQVGVDELRGNGVFGALPVHSRR